ncbi:MAG: hypothetical protein K2X87_21735 [Gemmataceae bacterium]|nr:hypothetical protein [Gemmataceae bacterium]
MDPTILKLVRDDPRYAYEAYEFVCEAVTHTQDRLGRSAAGAAEDEDRHVSGGELLRGACELAVREFGLMAPVVFRRWGVRTSDDFGELVFRLIAARRLSKSDDDDPADFRDALDLNKALAEGFELTLGEPARRGKR